MRLSLCYTKPKRDIQIFVIVSNGPIWVIRITKARVVSWSVWSQIIRCLLIVSFKKIFPSSLLEILRFMFCCHHSNWSGVGITFNQLYIKTFPQYGQTSVAWSIGRWEESVEYIRGRCHQRPDVASVLSDLCDCCLGVCVHCLSCQEECQGKHEWLSRPQLKWSV